MLETYPQHITATANLTTVAIPQTPPVLTCRMCGRTGPEVRWLWTRIHSHNYHWLPYCTGTAADTCESVWNARLGFGQEAA